MARLTPDIGSSTLGSTVAGLREDDRTGGGGELAADALSGAALFLAVRDPAIVRDAAARRRSTERLLGN